MTDWIWPKNTRIPPWLGLAASFAGVAVVAFAWILLPDLSPKQETGRSLALLRVQVFNGVDLALKPPCTILIEDGRIAKIGPEDMPIPEGSYIIQAGGLTAMPGLVDLHTYLSLEGRFPEDSRTVDPRANLERQLASGVTTVLDLNSDRAHILSLKELKDPLKYPYPLFAGPLYTSPGGWRPVGRTPWDSHVVEILDLDELDSHWQNHLRFRYDLCFVSVEHPARDRLSMPMEALDKFSRLARQAGIPLLVHVQRPEKARQVLQVKPTALTGPLWPEEVDDGFIRTMLEAGTAYIPGLSQVLNAWPARPQIPFLLEFRAAELLSQETLASIRNEEKGLLYAQTFTQRGMVEGIVLKNLQKLYAAGVPIGLGSMSGLPTVFHGLGATTEIEHMLEAGIPLPEVMKIATSRSAALVGLSDRGQIRPGFMADLLLVEGDPLTEKLAHRHIRAVIRGGRYMPREQSLPPDDYAVDGE